MLFRSFANSRLLSDGAAINSTDVRAPAASLSASDV